MNRESGLPLITSRSCLFWFSNSLAVMFNVFSAGELQFAPVFAEVIVRVIIRFGSSSPWLRSRAITALCWYPCSVRYWLSWEPSLDTRFCLICSFIYVLILLDRCCIWSMSLKWSRRSSGSALSYSTPRMPWSWFTYWSLNFSDFSELTSLSLICRRGCVRFSAKSYTSMSSLGLSLWARITRLASAFLV